MKAAVIGTGFGARVVAPAYRKAGMEVQVVSPRDADGVRKVCGEQVDLISVHSPPFMHRAHVLEAIKHGRNVLCDKPFGTCLSQSREMLQAAEAAGVLHFMNFEFRQEPVRSKVTQLIAKNSVGKIKHVQWRAMMSGSRVPLQRYRWLWDADLGGGWMGAFGSHAIDALRVWIGEVETANGIRRNEIPYRLDADSIPRQCTAEDAFTACLTFKSGASAVIDASYASSTTRPYLIEIFGSEGTLTLDTATLIELKRPGHPDERFEFEPWPGDMHEPALTRWAEVIRDAIRDRRQIEPSFRDGVACVEVMDKFKRNAVWLSQLETEN